MSRAAEIIFARAKLEAVLAEWTAEDRTTRRDYSHHVAAVEKVVADFQGTAAALRRHPQNEEIRTALAAYARTLRQIRSELRKMESELLSRRADLLAQREKLRLIAKWTASYKTVL
jgi:hypothetical protein